ncbi:uncharacterized protein SAPINGB_P000742 [Magnusiomyces paraingens]|uniref:Scaffold protein Nfu/NifU N-terminal domain-containing protein n=1 Tax=Magnusiomyces paraingens TaxID=2606893 RepID=A0A5E8B726_9ASCO|nr:uncharacterized protein SAPINGB_P000742 [Saprochaete ingens]VVT45414.1 unnamed protein product [Saprochaete ingens]
MISRIARNTTTHCSQATKSAVTILSKRSTARLHTSRSTQLSSSSTITSSRRPSLRPLTRIPSMQARSMFIQTTPTPNEDALKFLPSQRILPASFGTRTMEFLSGRDAHASPLARKLFAIDGVKSVMLGPDFLTVEKVGRAKGDDASSGSVAAGDEDPAAVSWMVLKPEIFAVLTEHLSAGLPVVVEGTHAAADTAASEDDDEVVAMIKELIDTRIRPAIQEDGGDIEYRGFTPEGVVQLKLQGACRSCDSSSVTLKNGIESMLMHYVEEVTGVEQVLDPEEQVAINEFAKFEEKLKKQKGNGSEESAAGTSTAPPAL